MASTSYHKFAGICAILAGIGGFLYAVAFIILRDPLLYSLFLLLIGLFSTAAMIAVYHRLRATDESFALWALLLGLAGALGSAIHGGFDLATVINPPPAVPADLAGRPEVKALLDYINSSPSQIDPRGLLAFGVTGIALFVIAWLTARGGAFPKALAYLGYLSAVLLIVLYLGRLIVLSPANPIILLPALLNGFIVSPVWYIWLGLQLTKGGSAMAHNPSEMRSAHSAS